MILLKSIANKLLDTEQGGSHQCTVINGRTCAQQSLEGTAVPVEHTEGLAQCVFSQSLFHTE